MERRGYEAKRAPHAVNLNDIDDASRQVHGDDFLVESTEERKVDIEVFDNQHSERDFLGTSKSEIMGW